MNTRTPGRAATATAVVCGIGSCLPPRSLTNEEIVARGELATTDAWIRSRTGIARRRHAAPDVSTGDLALAAGEAAMRSAPGVRPDLVLIATTTPDRPCPATAPDVAHRLGLGTVPAFDLAAVCSGFLYALTTANALITQGTCRNPLVIGAEKYSAIVDPRDRDTAPIFGDGAGAFLLRPGDRDEPGALVAADLGADGAGSDLIAVAGGGSRLPDTAGLDRDERYFRMRGRQVYARAVTHMTRSAHSALDRAGWPAPSIEAFIGHQANQRILDSVAERLGVPAHHRFGNIADVGNTAAASIPLALADTAARRLVRPGARALLTAFGGGLTWGAIALTWPAVLPHTAAPAPRPPSHTLTDVPPDALTDALTNRSPQPWKLSASTS
ncbi:beta-ketoacyl-ACP synthase III [Streptomyces liangshanensis]|uniref:Beta-ketoacyl-[acyl-carrier-protein] synthase III n=1 Tax=Streptomyces liangshanensis TaxID=2717324 RepID=A0A6G9GYN6_9ACTN|nr:beta-ketoacyl-ACP synthase III [Streptomyces liangshanensis]QIQ03388.1 beta-ketoacyl-ACP synthase 3 [Streptomyces liangshanensis]